MERKVSRRPLYLMGTLQLRDVFIGMLSPLWLVCSSECKTKDAKVHIRCHKILEMGGGSPVPR